METLQWDIQCPLKAPGCRVAVSSAARRSALARRRRLGPLQVGSTGMISITTRLRSTVPDKPPHIGI